MVGRGSSPFGAAAFSRPTHFPKNDEAAFRLQAAASKVTGLQACGSNSTPAVRLSAPYHSRSSAASADRLSRRHCQSNSACRRVESRRSHPAGQKKSPMDGGRDAPGAAAPLRVPCSCPCSIHGFCARDRSPAGPRRQPARWGAAWFTTARRAAAGCGAPS
jgi:hypothetical protein